MKPVFEALLTHSNQMECEDSQLYTSLRKAHERLLRQHARSEWAGQPLPALATCREQLREFSSHSVQVVNEDEKEAEFTISIRPVN